MFTKSTPASRSCAVCGSPITKRKSPCVLAANRSGNYFCSRAHYWEWRREHPVTSEKQRAAASKTMQSKWEDPAWREAVIHRNISRRRPKKPRGEPRRQRIEVRCDTCGEAILRPPCKIEAAKHHFCSRECAASASALNFRGAHHHGYSCEPVPCANCGKELLVPRSKRKVGVNHFCSHKGCYAEWLTKRPREEHPRYNGGGETDRAAWDKNGGRKWKRDCQRRDGWRCGLCGRQYAKYSENPHVHHRAPFSAHAELRSELDNGITLCRDCHRIVHMRVGQPLREYWEQEVLARHACKAVVY